MSLPRSRTTFHSAPSFIGTSPISTVSEASNTQPSQTPLGFAVTSSANTRARATSTLPVPVGHNKSKRLSPIGVNKYTLFLAKRLLTRPLLWVVVVLVTLILWWSNAGTHDGSSDAVQMRLRRLFPPEITRDLQFYPASNHKIHVSSDRAASCGTHETDSRK